MIRCSSPASVLSVESESACWIWSSPNIIDLWTVDKADALRHSKNPQVATC